MNLLMKLLVATYSNLENHPRLIRAREAKKTVKIKLDPKTGLPIVEPAVELKKKANLADNLGSDKRQWMPPGIMIYILINLLCIATRVTVSRQKNESKDEKRARKQAVKEERQTRRAEKKATKDQYTKEKIHQVRVTQNAPKKGIKKL